MAFERCPVCDGTRLAVFLRRNQVPVHQNLVMPDREGARAVTRGDLDLAVCEDCGFVHNRAFNPAKLSYGKTYDNTQSCSAYFDAYLDGLITDLVEVRGVRNSNVIEVGCGKGQFLGKLVRYPGAGNRGLGFDPSHVGPESELDGRLEFRHCFFDATTGVTADFVVCRHVIEHVPEPLVLLRSIRAALKDSPNARVFFETPCVDWILRNRVAWDFFYEHCALFSAESLSLAFERAAFQVGRVEHVFDGQYLWLEARPVAHAAAGSMVKEADTAKLAKDYGADENTLCAQWLSRLTDLNRRGKVALWGAGAKGATLANLVDAACVLVDCVVDINPNKQGRFIPGTGHPIVAPRELRDRDIRSAILMNPNYRAENRQLMAEAGIEIELIDWNMA